MKKPFAWIFVGGAIVAFGIAGSLSACSSDDTGTPDTGTKDSTSPDTGNNKDTGTQDTSTGDTGPSDAGTGCEVQVPANAPFTTDSGPYCPFQGDGSTFAACNNGAHCCVTSNLNSCQEAGACTFIPDAGTTADFECNENNDCAQGSICCERAGSTVKGPDPGCSYEFVSAQKGSQCVVGTTCPVGQSQICGQTSDCNVGNGSGNTCYPLDTKAMWLGVCHTSDGGLL